MLFEVESQADPTNKDNILFELWDDKYELVAQTKIAVTDLMSCQKRHFDLQGKNASSDSQIVKGSVGRILLSSDTVISESEDFKDWRAQAEKQLVFMHAPADADEFR